MLKYHLEGFVFFLLRIVSGFLLLCHGAQKVFGVLGAQGPEMHGMMGVAGCIELVCGSLVLLGLLTKPAAFIASGEMASAYFMVHAKMGFFPIVNHGELAVAYCFALLYIAAHGPGGASLDALIFRRKKA